MPKILKGKVISTAMNKTLVVAVERSYRHHLYRKTVKRTKKYKVHYEGKDIVKDQEVSIVESRPISKEKHFKIYTQPAK